MCKLTIGIAFLGALAIGSPPDVFSQKKPKEQSASTADYKSLENIKELEGKLITLEPTTRRMTLKVGYAYLEPNPNFHPNSKANADYVRRVNKLIRQQQKALTIANPVKRIERLQQLAIKAQVLQLEAPVGPPPFRPAVAYKDVEAEATEDVVVRRAKLPVQYDDKGGVKEYTEKEKKELRGKDPKIPGYAALWADVQTGQQVKLYLKSKKAIDRASKKTLADSVDKTGDKSKTEDKAKAAERDDSKDIAADTKGKGDDSDKEPRVYTYMILIETEPDSAASAANPPKKNRNNN
jgi:hypothetical protein